MNTLREALQEYLDLRRGLGYKMHDAGLLLPVALLAPGKGKTKRAYVWVYRTTNFALQRPVFYDFCKDRSGEHPRRVLHAFAGTLVTDDYAAYHALHRRGVTAAFSLAHAFPLYEHSIKRSSRSSSTQFDKAVSGV